MKISLFTLVVLLSTRLVAQVSEQPPPLVINLKDRELFAFWKGYAGTKLQELEQKALSNPELYADICESPFKSTGISTDITLPQRMVGIWYSKKTAHGEAVLLTKNRPKSAFQGLQIWRLYPDDVALRTDYMDESAIETFVDEGNWFIEYEHNCLTLNGLGRKLTVQPNGDLLLTPLSKSIQQDLIADNPEDFLIGTWQRQLPIPNQKGRFYTEIITIKEDNTFALNNGDTGTLEILDTSEKEMAHGKLTIEFTITKRKELNVDMSIDRLVLMADKTQIKIHLKPQQIFIKQPNFSTAIPFIKR
jgi:hypothetical protein